MACFNPRVRAGRDQRRLRNPRRGNVSIHASARDATASAASDWEWIAFQSTRPRGTRHYDEVIQPLIDVSIHASARDATAHFRLCRHGAPVSIHASARDATVTANGVPEYILVSIHASARDATRQLQSTRPRGTRPHRNHQWSGTWHVSIHASARDATFQNMKDFDTIKFQSTRPRGTRQYPQ